MEDIKDAEYTYEDFLLEKSERPEWRNVQWEDVDPSREEERQRIAEEKRQYYEDMYPNGSHDIYDEFDY
jgi:hypothetical protein|tara:strand:- start:123 stop:329 length:207 start_codon:yes stop_codon:yes gene_type:complete